MNEREWLLKKLKCKCGGYFQSKYTNEELLKKFPFKENDTSYRNLINMSKFIRFKRKMKCPDCGKQKKISKKLLVKISKLVHDL